MDHLSVFRQMRLIIGLCRQAQVSNPQTMPDRIPQLPCQAKYEAMSWTQHASAPLMALFPNLLLSSRPHAAILRHDPDLSSNSRQAGQMHDMLVHHAETARG